MRVPAPASTLLTLTASLALTACGGLSIDAPLSPPPAKPTTVTLTTSRVGYVYKGADPMVFLPVLSYPLRVGDDLLGLPLVSGLQFSLTSVPSDATVTHASLVVYRTGKVGNPILNPLQVDHINWPLNQAFSMGHASMIALDEDFDSIQWAQILALGEPMNGKVDVTDRVQTDILQLRQTSSYRLDLDMGGGNNMAEDYWELGGIFLGNNQFYVAELVVTYTQPQSP